MDLTYTPDELAFEREVRTWLKRNVPRRQRDERPVEFGDPRRIAEAKAWQRKVQAAGYLALAWPSPGRASTAARAPTSCARRSSTRRWYAPGPRG